MLRRQNRHLHEPPGQKRFPPEPREEKEPNYDTKYFISHCAHDSRRGNLAERGTHTERRTQFEQEREQSGPKNCACPPLRGRLELREGRMDSRGWLQISERQSHSHRRANAETSAEAPFKDASEFCENQPSVHASPRERRRQSRGKGTQPAPDAYVADGQPFVGATKTARPRPAASGRVGPELG